MSSYLSAAGPLAWPAILLGLLALAAATWHAFRQGERQAGVAKAATAASLICALINALLGYQVTISYLDGGGQVNPTLVLNGVGESLNAVVVTLAIAFLVSLLFLIAAFRHQERAGAA